MQIISSEWTTLTSRLSESESSGEADETVARLRAVLA